MNNNIHFVYRIPRRAHTRHRRRQWGCQENPEIVVFPSPLKFPISLEVQANINESEITVSFCPLGPMKNERGSGKDRNKVRNEGKPRRNQHRLIKTYQNNCRSASPSASARVPSSSSYSSALVVGMFRVVILVHSLLMLKGRREKASWSERHP